MPPRRSHRRDILASLALAAAIFVSILALPLGRVHEHACSIVGHIAGRPMPCGVGELNVSIDTDRAPWLRVGFRLLKPSISL